MNLYKTIILMFLVVGGAIGQELEVSSVVVDESITEEEKAQMIQNCKMLFNQYVAMGRLSKTTDGEAFLNLFLNEAEMSMDFMEGRNSLLTKVDPVSFVDLAATHFPEGLAYTVSDATLSAIEVTRGYTFEAIISFRKEYSAYLDERNKLINDGRLLTEQKITMSIDPYDLSIIDIKSIGGRVLSDRAVSYTHLTLPTTPYV